jgi:hypothetical protein
LSVAEYQYFLGTDTEPTDEQIDELIAKSNRVISTPEAVALLEYDHRNRTGLIHLYVFEYARHGHAAAEAIGYAVEQARTDGIRRLIAPLVDGNPWLKPGKSRKFGFTLEGRLRGQVLIGGEPRDLYLYARTL